MILKLFWAFLKIGTVGFGSGPAMVVLIEREMVDMKLMTTADVTDAVALSLGLPGPLATKLALYCGYNSAGVSGALASLAGLLLPSTIAILILARFISAFRDQPKILAVLKALKPVVVAIFCFLAWNSAKHLPVSWDILLIGLVAFAALIFKVEPALVILGAIVVGLLFY